MHSRFDERLQPRRRGRNVVVAALLGAALIAGAAMVLWPAREAIAQAAGLDLTREVLVSNASPTELGRANGSISISVDNYGPNTIWCALGKSGNAVVGKAKRVQPNETYVVDQPAGVKVYCLAATAAQLTTAATVVNEVTK